MTSIPAVGPVASADGTRSGPPPLVSVCVPTYNYGRFLPDCIESILAQTHADWELVLADDGSDDDSVEIALRYAEADARIRFTRNERRLGMNGNMAHVASLGTGRYLKILCADDWLAPDCLEKMVAHMESNPHVVLATSAEIHTDTEGIPQQVQFLFGAPVVILSGDEMLARMSRGGGFGGNSSFFIRASAFERVGGYDGSVPYAADYDLAARLCSVGDYLHTDAPLFYGRDHPHSSSRTDPATLVDVRDRFGIPDRIFSPRAFPDRNWRRHFLLSSRLTARYLVNAVLARLRGRAEYSRRLWTFLKEEGNFLGGVPFLAVDLPARVLKRLTRWHRPGSRRPEGWMGPPQ